MYAGGCFPNRYTRNAEPSALEGSARPAETGPALGGEGAGVPTGSHKPEFRRFNSDPGHEGEQVPSG